MEIVIRLENEQDFRTGAGRFYESSAFDVDEKQFLAFDGTFPPKEKAECESQQEFKLLVSLRY